MLTGTQIKTEFDLYKRDTSDVPNATFLSWINIMNHQIRNFLLGIQPSKFIASQTYTVSSNPQTSSQPSDLDSINYVGCGFFEIDSDGKDSKCELTPTGHGRRDRGYYIENGNIVFTGIEEAKQFKLRYIPKLSDLTALSQETVLENKYLNLARHDIDRLYEQWNRNPSMESIADFRFARVLQELGDTASIGVNVYEMPDFSNSF